MADEFYGACRIRRSREQMEQDYEALVGIVRQHAPASVRQVFYLASTQGLVPKTEAGYDRICRDLVQLRADQRIEYSDIADGTRWARRPRTFDSVERAIESTAKFYRRSLWADSHVSVEVWIEKDTLASTLWPVADVYDVPLMSSRGFSSLSFLWGAGQTLASWRRPAHIFYIGDFDPSGVRIDANIEKRLREFAPGIDIYFERLAVREDQIHSMNLATRPTKRAGNTHARSFNSEVSVEAEAIPPGELRQMLKEGIESYIPRHQLEVMQQVEEYEREQLRSLARSLASARAQGGKP